MYKQYKTWFDKEHELEIVHLFTYHFLNEWDEKISTMVFLNKEGRAVEKQYADGEFINNVKSPKFSFKKLWQFISEPANECTVDMEFMVKFPIK